MRQWCRGLRLTGELVSEVSLSVSSLRMFVLVEMRDTVRIPPWNFHRQLNEAISEELNKKLANKARAASSPVHLSPPHANFPLPEFF